MNLPHHRRIQWHILFRNCRRQIATFFIGLTIAILTIAWLAYETSRLEVADYRLKLSMLQQDTLYRTTLGSWTPTDIKEGTKVIDLREVRR